MLWEEAKLIDTLGSRIKALQKWFIEIYEKHEKDTKIGKVLVKNLAYCQNKTALQFGYIDKYRNTRKNYKEPYKTKYKNKQPRKRYYKYKRPHKAKKKLTEYNCYNYGNLGLIARNCKIPRNPKKKQLSEIVIEENKYTQIEYIDYELENKDSIYEFTNNDSDIEYNKILHVPTLENLSKIHQDEYYVISQKEHIIDCKYTEGKAINKEIQSKNPINYGATEILIKACFREEIEIYLADDRIREPTEKSIISANYSVAININNALTLYWKISGIKLAPGSKIFTARCKNPYILTNKHTIEARNKIDRTKIENLFDKILTVIDKNN